MKKSEFDISTGETITTDLTPDELTDLKDREARVKAYEQAKADKIAAKASAQAKLAALGLTEEEVASILA
jgi:hypothetical protein